MHRYYAGRTECLAQVVKDSVPCARDCETHCLMSYRSPSLFSDWWAGGSSAAARLAMSVLFRLSARCGAAVSLPGAVRLQNSSSLLLPMSSSSSTVLLQ